jgi:hypothetical protein
MNPPQRWECHDGAGAAPAFVAPFAHSFGSPQAMMASRGHREPRADAEPNARAAIDLHAGEPDRIIADVGHDYVQVCVVVARIVTAGSLVLAFGSALGSVRLRPAQRTTQAQMRMLSIPR